MRLRFEPDLDYQQDAIAAVCDLFHGQETCRSEFTVSHGLGDRLPGFQAGELGIGNLLQLPDEALLANLRQVQLRNGLLPADTLRSRDFTVEMETGTGKTYVFLRTILELNHRFGFTKFAIVVPSVAIKEGVDKSLRIMGTHLRSLYSGTPFEHFVYDSGRLGQVRNFAASPQVQIMLVTVGAINKRGVNNIYQPNEKTGGERPVDLVRATSPVLIVDEPQSVDGGLKGQGKQALQREIEEETGVRFGLVEPHAFASIGQLGVEQSRRLWDHLTAHGYLNRTGQAQDALREALDDERLALPAEFEPLRDAVLQALRRFTARIRINRANERRRVKPREAVLNSAGFQALWDRIKHKTTFRVRFDNEALLTACAQGLAGAPPIPRPRLLWQRGAVAVGRGGVTGAVRESGAAYLHDAEVELPDLLTDLQDRTGLTRRSLYRILADSGRLDDFADNPTGFIETAAEAINRRKHLALVEGIKYQRLGGEHYFAQELFRNEELIGYLKNTLATRKSVYDHVVYDSETEAAFAASLERFTSVKVYAKLPRWFQVPTPLGPYTPDWAVLIEDEAGERLYLVVETKGSAFLDDLRNAERAKVACGKAHFEALRAGESPARYRIVHTADELLA